MPDAERFDGLSEAIAAADDRRESKPAEAETNHRSENAVETELSGEAIHSPAFSFDATTAHSIYVRPETLAAIDDVEALVDARLRTEQAVRNLTTSEFYEAVLAVAIRDPDTIVEAVLANRVEAADDTD